MNIFLVIPTLNEKKRLVDLIDQVKKYIPAQKIIVVDDGSRIPEILPKRSRVWLLRHKINLGKGAAMRTGAEFAFGHDADAIIFMDADLQHDPKEIPKFISLLKKGNDVVLGSRRPNKEAPFVRVLGKKLIHFYVSLLFGVSVSDILSGYRALSRSAYKAVSWNSNRYGVETEMIVRMGRHKNNLKWTEFPIDSIYIDKYKGVTVIDAIRLLIGSIFWKFL